MTVLEPIADDLARYGGEATISVVGGGWSFKGIDPHRLPGLIIGVNDAALRLPRCDLAVSMDRLWAENRWGELSDRCRPADLLSQAKTRRAYIRRNALQNIARPLPEWCLPFECDHETMAPTAPWKAGDGIALNGMNSGACALNLAFWLRPRRIILWGFDHNRCPKTGDAYWHPPYPWAPEGATGKGKYRSWAAAYEPLRVACRDAGIETLNASRTSEINMFARIEARFVLL